MLRSWMLLLALLPAAAWAQDETGDQGDTEHDGLLEREAPPPKVAAPDPDAKLQEKVDQKRRAMEQSVNALQTEATEPITGLTPKDAKTYDKFSQTVGKLVTDFLAGSEKFVEKNRTLLDQYAAAAEGPARDKVGKDLIKERENYLKSLDKTGAQVDKIRSELNKIKAKVQAENPETPPPPPPAPPSEGEEK